MLTNPATGGQHWFHGTPRTFGQFRNTEAPEQSDLTKQENPAWNSGIGHHFTSLHHVANAFITGGNAEPNKGGWHLHARLGIQNPKHFDSELDMLHHAAGVVSPPVENHTRSYKATGVPISHTDSGPESTETHLKLLPGSAKHYRDHLISQGHDGITYGNEFEGPKGHICAIAFHHDQIKIADRHAGHDDLPNAHIAHKKKHPKHKGHPSHRVGHGGCSGFWHGGWCGWGGVGYIGHDSYCGTHGTADDMGGGDMGGDGGSVGGGGDGGGASGSKQATVLTDWKPTERLFAPTKDDPDPRLFLGPDHMKPEVRKIILEMVYKQLSGLKGAEKWSKVYLAGSEASLWWGNQDFDLLIGVDYDRCRMANESLLGESNQDITAMLNQGFAKAFNNEQWHPPFDPDNEWHLTGYVNLNSYDITKIKPYAAYNVTDDSWAVKPIKEPTGHQFSPSEMYHAEGVAERIKHILTMPEPARSQEATRMWHFLHADRSRAFGPHGEGAFDRGNVIEKYLDQAGLWQKLVNLRFKVGSITQEGGYHGSHEADAEWLLRAEAGKGKPRADGRGVGRASEPAQGAVGTSDDGGGAQRVPAQPARRVIHHPQLKKDLKGLQQRLLPKFDNIVQGLAQNVPHASTHPLKGSMKGWSGTNLDFNHRIVHKYVGDDELHIGHVGVHYEGAEQRLSGRWESEHDQKKRMDAEKELRAHMAAEHPDLVASSKPHAVMDMYHRIEHGTVGPQQQLDPGAHAHHPSIDPTQPFSVRHKNAVLHDEPKDPLDYSQCVSFKNDPSFCTWHKSDHLTNQGEPNPNVDGSLRPVGGGDLPRCDLCSGFHSTDRHYDAEHTNASDHEDHGHALSGFPIEGRVKVVPSDGDDSKQGIMVAIAPPARIVENLVLEEGESAENLHITIAYLGDLDSHSEAQIDMLPELVEAWAEGQPKLEARVQGAGTFVNEGSHVLWAAADIPGVNEMHVSLVQYLTGHGFDVRKDHSFTPHITLAYGKHHFRFLPKIEPTSWKVREVWCCIGGRWESFALKGR